MKKLSNLITLSLLIAFTAMTTSCASSGEFRGLSRQTKICAQVPNSNDVVCRSTPRYRNNNEFYTETDYDISRIRKPRD